MASPVLNRAGDRAYVVLQYGRVSAFSISSAGMLVKLWTTTLPNLGSHEVRATPALSADESTLYIVSGKDYAEPLNNVPSSEGRVYGLKTSDSSAQTGWTDGILAETYLFAHLAPSPVVLPDGKIVVATCFKNPADPNSDGGRLRAFSPNGSLAWQTASGQGVFESTPALGTDGRIIIPQKNGNKLRCYAASGTWLWDATMATSSKANPVVTSFGEIVIADFDGNIYCFTQDGANTWTIPAAYWDLPFPNFKLLVCQSPVVDAGGNVIIVDHFGRVVSIAPSGVERWSPKVVTIATLGSGETFSITSPVMTPTGEVLIMRENGKLYTFQNEHGPDAGIWPGFQRGSTHSGNIGENAIDRGNLSFAINYYPGSSYYVWNPSIGGTELVQNYSVVQAATDFGHVGGYQTANSYSSTIASEWFGGSPVQMFGASSSEVTGMNIFGDAVGRSGVGSSSPTPSAVFWDSAYAHYGYGGYLALRPFWQSSEASAINRFKWVVGKGKNQFGVTRAAFWPYGANTNMDLGTLKGFDETYSCEAVGISDLNDLAGNSVYGSGSSLIRPFRFRYDPVIHAEVKFTDKLFTPDFAALGYTVYPTESQFGSQYAVTLTPNGFIGGNWQTYTTDSLLTPYVHRPATTAAASYRIFPEWTSSYAPPSNPRTYRPRQLLGLNARGQALLRADVYDPNAGMQYLGQAYVLHTPSRTGYQNITSLVSTSGGTIYGLTDDGKIFGWRYNAGLPTGFVAVP